MAEARSRQIIIAGAGIAGLTAALAFAVRGYPVRVFERAPRLDEVGAGIQLSPNATRILDRLGVLPGLRHTAVRPDAVVLRDASSLAELGRVQLGAAAEWRWKAPYLTAHRADLQSALLAHVAREPGIQLVTGATVRDVTLHPLGRDGFGRDRRPHQPEHRACCSSAPTASGRTCAALSAARRRAASRARSPGAGPSEPKARPAVRSPRIGIGGVVTAFLAPGFHLIAYPVRAGAALNLVAFTRGNAMGETWSGKMDTKVLRQPRCGAPHRRFAKLAPTMPGNWTVWPIHTTPVRRPMDRAGRHCADRRRRPRHDALRRAGSGDGDRGCRDACQATCLPAMTAWPCALAAWEKERRKRIERVARRGAFNRLPGTPPGLSPWCAMLSCACAPPEKLATGLDWLYGWKPPSPEG